MKEHSLVKVILVPFAQSYVLVLIGKRNGTWPEIFVVKFRLFVQTYFTLSSLSTMVRDIEITVATLHENVIFKSYFFLRKVLLIFSHAWKQFVGLSCFRIEALSHVDLFLVFNMI